MSAQRLTVFYRKLSLFPGIRVISATAESPNGYGTVYHFSRSLTLCRPWRPTPPRPEILPKDPNAPPTPPTRNVYDSTRLTVRRCRRPHQPTPNGLPESGSLTPDSIKPAGKSSLFAKINQFPIGTTAPSKNSKPPTVLPTMPSAAMEKSSALSKPKS